MNISIEIDSRALRQAFEAAPRKTTRMIQNWVATTASLTEREEKQEVPVRTGALQNSVHQIVGGVKAEVKPQIKYAIFVHEGARGRRPNKFADRTYAKVKPVAERNANIQFEQLVRSI